MTRKQQSKEALIAWLRKQENGEEVWAGNVWSAAVEWADQHPQMKPENKLQDFKKEVEGLHDIADAEEYARQLAHLFLGNGLSLQTILLMAIDFGQQHPNWIPVEERKPNDGQVVFIYTKHGSVSSVTYKDGEFNLNEVLEAINVTHWMPIVPPRKEDNNEND